MNLSANESYGAKRASLVQFEFQIYNDLTSAVFKTVKTLTYVFSLMSYKQLKYHVNRFLES